MVSCLQICYEILLQKDMTFGSLKPDGQWTGMIGAMQRNETDISGPYFIMEERTAVVDFSAPFGFSQLAIVSGLMPANRDPFLIFKIFTMQVWLSIILSTFVATAAASVIYAVIPSPTKRAKADVFLKYVWMFYGSLLGKDYGSSNRWFLRHVIAAASFRILQCIWLLGPVMVLMYTYQGAITSTFAADKLKPIIENMEQLRKNTAVKPSTFKNSFPYMCFERLKGTRQESLLTRVKDNLKLPPVGYIKGWFDEVARGREVFVSDTVNLKSLIGQRFQLTGKCGLRVTPIDFCPAYVAFAFRKKFRPMLVQRFNKRLVWYDEGRLIQRRTQASLANYDICTSSSSGTVQALNLSDLTGSFLVYTAGISISVIVFFLEKAIKWRKLA